MKTALVTGGAGFIGSNLVIELVKQSYKVKVIDNLMTGKLSNLKPVIKKIKFIKGDIRDLGLLKKEFKGIDYIFHQAALISVPESVNKPLITNNVNVNGTLNVLGAAKYRKVKKVILASSCAIYGNSSKINKESSTPNPSTPYALTKYFGEYYSKLFHQLYELNTIVLRYFNVFGYNQNPDSQYPAVIPKFIMGMLKNKKPIIYGDGLQTRDFVFVQDVVNANILASKSNISGEIFNIASGKSVNLLYLIEKLNKILDTELKPTFAKSRLGDIKHSKADISKARNQQGYKPHVTFHEGLKKTINYLKNEQKGFLSIY